MSTVKALVFTVLTGFMPVGADLAAAQSAPQPPTLCVGDSCTPQAGIKWNPGHYMFPRSYCQRDDRTDPTWSTYCSKYARDNRFAHYSKSDFANNPNIVGAMVAYRWAQLEGNTRGDYSAGIALVRRELEYLKNLKDSNGNPAPKRLIMRVFDVVIPGCIDVSCWPGIYPEYLYKAGKVYSASSKYLDWKRWDAEAMGWYIDMFNAYAKEFDDDPDFEMICPFQETSIIVVDTTPAVPDYSLPKIYTQYTRLALALKQAWTKTNVWIPTNWGLGVSGLMPEYIAYLDSINVGAGNPDTMPIIKDGNLGSYVDRILRGEISDVDYRGKMLIVHGVEAISLGLRPDMSFTAEQIYDYANDIMHVSHMGWTRNTWTGTNEQRWYDEGTTNPGGILDVINSRPLTHTSKPSGYQ